MFEIFSSLNLTSFLSGSTLLLALGYFLSKREPRGIPPGPQFLPVLGNILDWRANDSKKKYKYFSRLAEQYGSIFRLYFGPKLMIILNDFQSINEVFIKKKEFFSSRPVNELWGAKSSVTEGSGIIWANDQEWKLSRRLALQSLRDLGFGKTILEERIKEETKHLVDYIQKFQGKPFRIQEPIIQATTNIISILVFGCRKDYNDPELLDILKLVELGFKSEGFFSPINVFSFIRFIPVVYAKLASVMTIRKPIRRYIDIKIHEHKQVFDENKINDFIDVMLANKDGKSSELLTDGNIRKMVLDLFFAGSDTTATTLDWACLFLVLHPDIQQKCQDEIDEVVGGGREINWSDKSSMPYVEATILEVQRLGTTAPFGVPHMANKDVYVNGYLIPQNSIIISNIYACHMDPKVWKDPFTFNPERFLDKEGRVQRNIPEFIPFSIGPRTCPGESLAKMELFMFLTGILQHFTLKPVKGEAMSSEGWVGVTMMPETYKLHADSRH